MREAAVRRTAQQRLRCGVCAVGYGGPGAAGADVGRTVRPYGDDGEGRGIERELAVRAALEGDGVAAGAVAVRTEVKGAYGALG